jgi:hypothetical protein
MLQPAQPGWEPAVSNLDLLAIGAADAPNSLLLETHSPPLAPPPRRTPRPPRLSRAVAVARDAGRLTNAHRRQLLRRLPPGGTGNPVSAQLIEPPVLDVSADLDVDSRPCATLRARPDLTIEDVDAL